VTIKIKAKQNKGKGKERKGKERKGKKKKRNETKRREEKGRLRDKGLEFGFFSLCDRLFQHFHLTGVHDFSGYQMSRCRGDL